MKRFVKLFFIVSLMSSVAVCLFADSEYAASTPEEVAFKNAYTDAVEKLVSSIGIISSWEREPEKFERNFARTYAGPTIIDVHLTANFSDTEKLCKINEAKEIEMTSRAEEIGSIAQKGVDNAKAMLAKRAEELAKIRGFSDEELIEAYKKQDMNKVMELQKKGEANKDAVKEFEKRWEEEMESLKANSSFTRLTNEFAEKYSDKDCRLGMEFFINADNRNICQIKKGKPAEKALSNGITLVNTKASCYKNGEWQPGTTLGFIGKTWQIVKDSDGEYGYYVLKHDHNMNLPKTSLQSVLIKFTGDAAFIEKAAASIDTSAIKAMLK